MHIAAKNKILNTNELFHWYDKNARDLPWRVSPSNRKSGIQPDPYRVWLSEIMLQQTTVATVKDYYQRFLQKWPTLDALANGSLDDVLKMWAGLGYYSRARNLHACAQQVHADFGGILPNSAADLQKLTGIGPYASAAIAAICFDEKIAVVDGNVERVMARLLALDLPISKAKPQIRLAVQKALGGNQIKRSGDFAQGMMDLGATICTPKRPRCNICPLAKDCRAFASENPEKYPVKLPKKTRPNKFGNAYIVWDKNGAIFLQKRADKGLLAQMSEVPNSEWTDRIQPPDFPFAGQWKSAGTIAHIFTHLKLELTVYVLGETAKHSQLQNAGLTGWWVIPKNLAGEALPTLFKKVIAKAGAK